MAEPLFKHRDHIAGTDIRAAAYQYGQGHTDTGVQITLDHGHTILAARLPREHARALADAILAQVDPDPVHVIQFRPDGWTIQHPLACRPNLFACPITAVAAHDLAEAPALPPPGRYECELNDIGDRFLIGDRVPGGDHA